MTETVSNTPHSRRLLFLGFVYPEELQDYVIRNERGVPQIAANKLGWLLVHGIEHAFGEPIDILSVLSVSRYPVFSKLIIAPRSWTRENGGECRFVPFLNIPLVKRLFIMLAAFLLLVGWLWRTRRLTDRAVTIYAMYMPTVVATVMACRLFGVPSVLIVPDLPEFMTIERGAPPRFHLARDVNRRLVYFCSQMMDGYVFLTKHMAERFQLDEKPSVVVEGCVDDNTSVEVPIERHGPERVVMYAGSLMEAYGVQSLLQGFMELTESDVRLWLCGRGELEADIQRYARTDARIEYFGPLPNAEALRRERQATVLINPRPSHAEFTRYSFPSKNLEYMSTGRPVIISRLPGIPDEYFDYVYPLNDESAHGVAVTLREALSKPREELDAFGKRAQTFVRQQKNYRQQGQKIRGVLEEVLWRRTIGVN